MENSTEASANSLLEIRGISKSFGSIKAVDNVSLKVRTGEIVAVVGPNGAGKSTVMHAISGVIRPDQGTILIDDSPVEIKGPKDSRQLGIEIVYQNLALINTLSVAGNIHLGREIIKGPSILQWLDTEEMRATSRKLVTQLKLNLDPAQPVEGLSGGQRQAVALARAILHQARFAVFDEPTAALGVIETRATLKVIEDFRNHGLGVIVVSHNMEDIFSITDRIVAMRAGRIVGERATETTSPDEIVALMMGGDAESENSEWSL